MPDLALKSRSEAQDLDQLRAMQREATRPDGLRRVLRRVARTVDGHAALLDETGQPAVMGLPRMPADLLAGVADEIERVRRGQAHSAAVAHGTQVIAVLALGQQVPAPVLITAGGEDRIFAAKDLLADAALLLWLCWQREQANNVRQRLDLVDSHVRMAVLYLLAVGDTARARRIAAALGPSLPTLVRVYIVELHTGPRDALVSQCTTICENRGWVSRCLVYDRQVIALAPADDAPEAAQDDSPAPITTDPIEDRFRALALGRPDLHVGAGHIVPLNDVIIGYEQAFHALSAAKSGGGPFARFDPREELAALLGQTGRAWARQQLDPLLAYVPARSHDPDADELAVTLGSWLTYYTGATKQLKIHRNTLSARLKHIGRLLNCDVQDLRTQAILHLALRILRYPPSPGTTDHQTSLAALLDTAAVRRWAQRQLAPLLTDNAPMLTTLRLWLVHNARLDATAAALGISLPGTRKRLQRLEHALERSLLNGPSARYDLWLALRIHDKQPF